MKNGHVYIIENPNGLIKIGKSGNIEKRIASLERQGGFKSSNLFVSELCSNYSNLETQLHKKLKTHRKIGEWFECEFNSAVSLFKTLSVKPAFTKQEIEENNEKRFRDMQDLFNQMFEKEMEIYERKHKYHCDCCMCPIELWQPLETYKSDKCCIFYDDFLNAIFRLEETNSYNYNDVLNKCSEFENEFKDIPCFEDTIKECIEICVETGPMSEKYIQN